jgi:SOS-response transcriptional repressor LexA
MTPDARLREIRKARGFATAAEAARFFAWNENSYKSHESGIRAISKKAAAKYASAFHVAVGWLLFGEGPVANDVKSVSKSELALRRIPRLDWGALKDMATISQAIEVATEFYVASMPNKIGPLAFSVRVSNDSMVGRDVSSNNSFLPGDELIFDPEYAVSPGDFILAYISNRNEPVFRQYRIDGYDAEGRVIATLHPLNPNWPDEKITLNETGAILAKLIRHSRDFV